MALSPQISQEQRRRQRRKIPQFAVVTRRNQCRELLAHDTLHGEKLSIGRNEVKRRDFFTRDRRGPQGPDDLPRFRNAPDPELRSSNAWVGFSPPHSMSWVLPPALDLIHNNACSDGMEEDLKIWDCQEPNRVTKGNNFPARTAFNCTLKRI